ncbi:hypothetical protein B296_00045159, partial [Ensete ventricosum]
MYVLTVKAATAEKGEAERELSWSVLSASVLGVSTSVSVPLGRLVCVPGAGDEGRGDLLEDLGLDLAPLRVGGSPWLSGPAGDLLDRPSQGAFTGDEERCLVGDERARRKKGSVFNDDI